MMLLYWRKREERMKRKRDSAGSFGGLSERSGRAERVWHKMEKKREKVKENDPERGRQLHRLQRRNTNN